MVLRGLSIEGREEDVGVAMLLGIRRPPVTDESRGEAMVDMVIRRLLWEEGEMSVLFQLESFMSDIC